MNIMHVALADELITREDGPVRANRTLRDKVAIFADGRCLVSRSNAEDVDVLSVMALARRMGFHLHPPEYVDLGSLRSFYAGPERDPADGSLPRVVNDDTAMQREVQDLLRQAAALMASDIHIAVEGETASVRIRTDGELVPMVRGSSGGEAHWRADHGRQICMTAYAMAAEGGTADANYDPFGYQAGRITTGLPPGVQAVRLQFNPVGFSGRHLVMRLLYRGHAAGASIADLGFAPHHVDSLGDFCTDPTGIVVISGPTGSGKTTTLERLMRRIVQRNPGQNVLSVEDPPEYRIPGVVQLPVSNLRNDEDRDDAYTEAIAAALRSDPDRIMIGEIRTRAAAHHAFEAAMTGHQVLTTLHANDALGVVPRLLDIGVEAYKLRDPSLVQGLVAQRLIRRLCPHCRSRLDPPYDRLDAGLAGRLAAAMNNGPVWLPGAGCSRCRQGYDGRTVIAETVRPDQKLLDLLCAGERQGALEYWLRVLGGRPLLDHALAKLAAGLVDPLQVELRIGRIAR